MKERDGIPCGAVVRNQFSLPRAWVQSLNLGPKIPQVTQHRQNQTQINKKVRESARSRG